MASHRVALPPPYFLFEEGMVTCMASIVSAFILRTSFGQRALPDVCLEIERLSCITLESSVTAGFSWGGGARGGERMLA